MNCTVEGRSLAERVKPRLPIEEQFARMGHTFRHGPLHRLIEHYLIRPTLRLGLRTTGLYSRGVKNALTPVVRRIPLSFPNLPPAFEGFQLMQISDFHIDGVDGLAEALAAVLEPLRPDACVFTGDYRFEDSGPCDEVYPRMRRVIESITARDGIYGIFGNHDPAEIAFALESFGVRMLVNEALEIERGGEYIWIAGIDDPFDYHCDDLPAALGSIPPDAFRVLLAHAPELFGEAAAGGVDLYLSGHTHGGQIRLPMVGAIRQNANCPREYAHGLWKHGNMHGYTSAGVGCSSLPVRFNCPPEVVLFELGRGS
jgi:predicted MPP superfamily phosphohydrolase